MAHILAEVNIIKTRWSGDRDFQFLNCRSNRSQQKSQQSSISVKLNSVDQDWSSPPPHLPSHICCTRNFNRQWQTQVYHSLDRIDSMDRANLKMVS
jgi:hypothetical protein